MRYFFLATVLSLVAACSDDQSTCEPGAVCTSPDLGGSDNDVAVALDATTDTMTDSDLLPDVGGDASLDTSDTGTNISEDAEIDVPTFDVGDADTTDEGMDAGILDATADFAQDAGADGGADSGPDAAQDTGTTPGTYDETNWPMKTWTKNESASTGTPDSYFFDVDSGSPLSASITGGGNGTWSVNVYGGYSNQLYPCSGTPSCQVMLRPEDTTVIITAITTDIGYYQLTVRYSGTGLQ